MAGGDRQDLDKVTKALSNIEQVLDGENLNKKIIKKEEKGLIKEEDK